MWRYFTMIYLIIISWYLIGAFGFIWVMRKINGRTTRRDIRVGLTLGGISGLLSWIVGLYHLMTQDDWY
jgi:NADH:ubiquinone oxidoreductase subunit H